MKINRRAKISRRANLIRRTSWRKGKILTWAEARKIAARTWW